MLTVKFWRALKNPPDTHPVFRRIYHQHPLIFRRRYLAAQVTLLYLAGCCGLAFFWETLWNALLFIVFFTIVFLNLLYSLNWAVNVSGLIAREREAHTYDLLCLSPPGALVISWAICTGRLHRTPFFKWFHFSVRLLSLIVGVTLLIALCVPLLISAYYRAEIANSQLFATLVYAVGLTAVFYIDHIQSIILGSLVGIMAPAYRRHSSEARFRAVWGFLLLKLAGYALAGAITIIMLPVVFSLLNFPGWLTSVSLSILGVIVFYVAQESILAAVWNRLTERLNVDADDLDMVLS